MKGLVVSRGETLVASPITNDVINLWLWRLQLIPGIFWRSLHLPARDLAGEGKTFSRDIAVYTA